MANMMLSDIFKM